MKHLRPPSPKRPVAETTRPETAAPNRRRQNGGAELS